MPIGSGMARRSSNGGVIQCAALSRSKKAEPILSACSEDETRDWLCRQVKTHDAGSIWASAGPEPEAVEVDDGALAGHLKSEGSPVLSVT